MYSSLYKVIRRVQPKSTKKMLKNYKNLNNTFGYFLVNNRQSNESFIATSYLYRLNLFIRLCRFFKNLRFNYNMLLKVFYTRFYNLWILFVSSGKRKLYYLTLKYTLILFKKLFLNPRLIKTNTYVVRPNHFLVDLPLSATGRNMLKPQYFSFFCSLKKTSSYRFTQNLSKLLINDFGDNYFTIHFIRTQRRYNKRRYSRVRAFSRPSFFAGISLSSMFIGSFWNGSIKNVDWLTAWPVVIDINVILFVLVCYVLFRLYKIYYISIFVRKRGKIKIINALNQIFTTKVLQKIFNFN